MAIQETITHEEHLGGAFSCNSFDLWRSSELPQKRWHHSHNKRKWLKRPQCHCHKANLHKSDHSSLFWCILCTVTSDISSSSKNLNNAARISSLFFRFLWLWLHYATMTCDEEIYTRLYKKICEATFKKSFNVPKSLYRSNLQKWHQVFYKILVS